MEAAEAASDVELDAWSAFVDANLHRLSLRFCLQLARLEPKDDSLPHSQSLLAAAAPLQVERPPPICELTFNTALCLIRHSSRDIFCFLPRTPAYALNGSYSFY